MENKINEININNFIYNGENIWPLFRDHISFSFDNMNFETKRTNAFKNKFMIILNFFKYLPKFIFILFKKFDCIFFTYSMDYRKINGNPINLFTHILFDKIKNKNILEIQSGYKIIKSDKNIYYVSYDCLLLLQRILSQFIVLNDISHIETELKKLNSKLNAKKIIKRYIANNIINNMFYKIISPKNIFFASTFFNEVKAANDLGINTIEFQHGVIINNPTYDVNDNTNSSFYAKTLLVFGSTEVDYLKKRFYSKDIIPIGNMAIEFFSNKENEMLKSLKKDYKFVVCITLQWTVLNRMLEFVDRQASKFQDICFIIIPREKNDLENYNFKFSNVKCFYDISFYEIVKNCDFHITCYSTCSLEAPSFGVQNIFVNIENFSKMYCQYYIEKYDFNYIIESDKDLSFIYSLKSQNKLDIINKNKDIISTNYTQNLKNFLKLLDIDII